MFAVAISLLYVAIVKHSEPLLLIPIAFGIILANIPPEASGILNEGGFLYYIKKVSTWESIPLSSFLESVLSQISLSCSLTR